MNPLRIKEDYANELDINLLLYHTGTSRLSAKIIEKQAQNFGKKKGNKSVEAAHKLKEQAIMMKEALLTGQFDKLGDILDFGWHYKKQMANGISNPVIDDIYATARKAGATGGKISGAGGGGYMIFYCPKNTRYNVNTNNDGKICININTNADNIINIGININTIGINLDLIIILILILVPVLILILIRRPRRSRGHQAGRTVYRPPLVPPGGHSFRSKWFVIHSPSVGTCPSA